MLRLFTKNATGVAPDGRWYPGDINALQDAVAAISDLTQTLGIGQLQLGETGLQLLRFGPGEARLTGHVRADGIVRALGGEIAGTFTTTQRDAIPAGSRPYGLKILNTTTNRYEWNAGTDAVPVWAALGTPPPQFGTRATRPAASAMSGQFYYATDQMAAYLSDGTTWYRMGVQAGDVDWTMETSARAGYVICAGQAWPSTTGIYADLFAKWGGQYPTTLPDHQARVFAAVGPHTDMSAVGNHDGLLAGLRRMIHKHSRVFTQPTVNSHGHGGGNHSHIVGREVFSLTPGGTAYSIMGGAGSPVHDSGTDASGTVISAEAPGTSGGNVTVGPQTGNEPTDTVAYIVMQPQTKL